MRIHRYTYVVILSGILIGYWADTKAQINAYSSQYQINDSLIGLPSIAIGPKIFCLSPNSFGYDILIKEIVDSNSYSEIEYNFSPRAIQILKGSILRPLNKYATLDLRYYKNSSPGWVQRSKSKELNFYANINWRVSRRWILCIRNDFKSLQREQNGGLKSDTTYNFEGSLGGNLSLVNNNIYLSSAENLSRNSQISAEGICFIKDSKEFKTGFRLVTSGFKQFYRYLDKDPNVLLYSKYNYFPNSTIRDSASLNGLNSGGGYFLSLSRDSARSIYTSVSIMQQIGLYDQDGRVKNFQNSFINGQFNYSDQSKSLKLVTKIVALGINQGENNSTFNYRQIIKKDSNGIRHLSAELSASNKQALPGYIFTNYRSDMDTNNLNVKLISTKTINIRLLYFGRQLSAAMCGGVTSRSNAVFFDINADPIQLKEEIMLVNIGFHSIFTNERWYLDLNTVYQKNLQNETYSLPRWNHFGSLAFKFKLFQNSINTKAGCSYLFFSHYRARGYLPWYNQFCIQSDQNFGNYIQLDAFINMEIKGVTAEFRMNNLGYGYLSESPIISPCYPSVPRYFSVSVKWAFRN